MIEISPERRFASDIFEEDDRVLVEEDGIPLPLDGKDKLPDNFKLYSRDIRRYPKLKEGEEEFLGLKIEQGRQAGKELAEGLLDSEHEEWLVSKLEEAKTAKRRLYEANLALPIWIAKRHFWDKGVPILDLVQEGNVVMLAKAVERFNWRLGSFANYASWCLKRAMDDAISVQIYPLSVTVSAAKERGRILQIADILRQVFGRNPGLAEVAEAAGVDGEEMRLLMTGTLQGLSFDAENGREGETLGERISDSNAVSPPEAALAGERAEIITEELGKLHPRTCEILVSRFGLKDSHERTNGEVGKEFRLTRQRVQQILSDDDGAFPTLAKSERLQALL